MKQYLKFEYLYIFLVIIWEPFQKFILKVDGSNRTILICSLILIAKLLQSKEALRIAFEKPLVLWGIWVLYAYGNSLVKGLSVPIALDAFFTLLFVPYLLMIVINLEIIKNKYRLQNVLIFSMYIAVIIVRLFDNVKFQGRIGGGINSNTTGLMSLTLLMYLYLKFVYNKLKIKYLFILSIIPLSMIVLSGSKTAFGGFLLLLITHIIIHRSKNIIINVAKLTISLLILIGPYYYIMNNTLLGKRLSNTTNEAEEIDIDTGSTILNKFGDRGIFYYMGWQVFKENPITGIGLENYKFYIDSEEEQHSEYMIQLCELGVVGSLIFILFYATIFKKLRKLKVLNKRKKYFEVYMAYLIIILLLITATRMYRVWYLFSIIGMVTGFIQSEEKRLLHLTKNKLRLISIVKSSENI